MHRGDRGNIRGRDGAKWTSDQGSSPVSTEMAELEPRAGSTRTTASDGACCCCGYVGGRSACGKWVGPTGPADGGEWEGGEWELKGSGEGDGDVPFSKSPPNVRLGYFPLAAWAVCRLLFPRLALFPMLVPPATTRLLLRSNRFLMDRCAAGVAMPWTPPWLNGGGPRHSSGLDVTPKRLSLGRGTKGRERAAARGTPFGLSPHSPSCLRYHHRRAPSHPWREAAAGTAPAPSGTPSVWAGLSLEWVLPPAAARPGIAKCIETSVCQVSDDGRKKLAKAGRAGTSSRLAGLGGEAREGSWYFVESWSRSRLIMAAARCRLPTGGRPICLSSSGKKANDTASVAPAAVTVAQGGNRPTGRRCRDGWPSLSRSIPW